MDILNVSNIRQNLWVDKLIYGEKSRAINASKIIRGILPYAQNHLDQGGKLWDICRHIIQIVEGVPGAKSWRKNLSLEAQKEHSEIIILEKAAQQLENAGL